ILALRDEFETSVEMTARRVVELSEYCCAVVFSKNNVVRYAIRSHYFPTWLCVKKGDKLPAQSQARQGTSDPNEWHEIDAYWWLADGRRGEDAPESVYEQTLVQESGHKITLLSYDAE